LITLGAACCGGMTAVIVAGSAADYLMAEIQFWLLAALVSMLQLARADLPATRAALPAGGPRTLGTVRQ
jgi:hypothetical protein